MKTATRFLKWLVGLFSTQRKFVPKRSPLDFSFYVQFIGQRYPDVAEYLSGRECWIVWLFVTKCESYQRSLTPKYVSHQYMKSFYPEEIGYRTMKNANTGYVSKSLNSLHLKGVLDYNWHKVDKRRYKQYNLKKKFFSAIYEQQD